MVNSEVTNKLTEVRERIEELRDISGFTPEEMAVKTEVSLEQYMAYETGAEDLPFTFIHKCSLAFGVEITDLLEGQSAKLTSYNITRRGKGKTTSSEDGTLIQNLAPHFRKKLANPYWVKYEYSNELQSQPIHCTTHAGQEFDLVIKGKMKIQVGENTEILGEGDSIYYKSSTPHGMIAVDGEDVLFLAMIMADGNEPNEMENTLPAQNDKEEEKLLCYKFIKTTEDEKGLVTKIDFPNSDKYNFAFDTVDAIGRKYPEKLAMLHVSEDMTERRFTFKDIKEASSQAANYFKSLGIKKGDRVLLVLKRHYQFWFCILGLHKLGAVAIPATNQLVVHDYEYRFNAAEITAVIATGDGDTTDKIDEAQKNCPSLKVKIVANGSEREGWHNFDNEYSLFSRHFERTSDSACGNDPMIMFFTSGTTGYPKIAAHSYKYALGHFITAKYWHGVHKEGLHFTISETGWGKALWGKLYGQWLSEAAIFTYDFDRFDASKILPMFKQYNITTFCAPPTMYRMLIKQDISQYDLSSIKHATTAGEALNPEVFKQFEKATGLRVHEGFGQTETTLSIANLNGMPLKVGAMGKPTPLYDIELIDLDGKPVADGESGEICIHTENGAPCGLFLGYYRDEEKTKEVWHDGLYHTGDVAWRDEDGYLWYVGRVDDVIKSSGYRIGPFEIENVIMELPYVLECGVSAAPDEVRGQVVKASIVLTNGTEGTEELKKEIQNYVKKNTAPYKYPRIVVFKDELPKTISGKIIRNKL